MRLNFAKMNPAGNTTIYVFDPLPRKLHGTVARELMKPELLFADQVGFIEKPESIRAVCRLQMMGGEFCGNATRALAALLVERGYPGIVYNDERYPAPAGRDAVVPLEVSGCDSILETVVQKERQANAYRAETQIPLPTLLQEQAFELDGETNEATVVEFPGITHVIFSGVAPREELLPAVNRQLAEGAGVEALGVMFYEPENSYLTPLVYIKASASTVWEGSCGSGSVAVGAALAREKKESVHGLVLQQPGGTIEVDVEYGNDVLQTARIKGRVELVAEGMVTLNL